MHHNFRTAVLFLLKHFIAISRLAEVEPVADHDGRVNLARFDPLEQWGHIIVRMGLTHFKFKAFVEGHSKIKLVDKTYVDARH